MRILLLDDDQHRHKQFRKKLIGSVFVGTETVIDCIRELETNGPWDLFFCDHDLDHKTFVKSGPGTGYEVILWIKDNPDKKPNKIIIHSLNDVGANEILKILPEVILKPGIFMGKMDIFNIC